jgi:hypothetical protein
MLNLVLIAVGAFNQVIVFIAALLCTAVGVTLLGDAVHWMLHAVRVQGKLIGVRQSGHCFLSVYRYSLPSGQSYEGTSNQGSSSVRQRNTGTATALWVIPTHPLEVEEARSHVWTLIGAVFLLLGLWLLHLGATAWPVGPMTWVVGALLLAHLAVRAVRTLRPRDPQLARRAVASGDTPVQSIEQIEASPERRAAVAQQQLSLRRWRPAFIVLGPALLALAVYLGHDVARVHALGLRASGVVQTLAVSHGHNGSIYHPVVQFTARNGQSVRFQDAVGTNPPGYRVGDRVVVLYLPGELQAARIDRGLWNWLPALITLIAGGVLCRVALARDPAR